MMFLEHIIINSIAVIIFYWYCQNIFMKSELNKGYYLLLLLLIILESLVNLMNNTQINLMSTLIVYFCISFIFFKYSLKGKVMFIFLFIIASFLSEMIAFILLNPLLTAFQFLQNWHGFDLAGSLITFLILSFIVISFTKVVKVKDVLDNKNLRYFKIIPLLSILMISLIMSSNLLVKNSILCFMITISLFSFNIVFCVGYADIIKAKYAEVENLELKRIALHNEIYKEKLENSNASMHDYKKHIQLLTALSDEKEYERLAAYLNGLLEEIKRDESLIYTGNQLIDLILKGYREKLTKLKIHIKYDIKVKELAPILDKDFNTVFSNILDNAIDSCMRCEGHYIKVKLDKADGFIILKIFNPCNEINADYNTIKSHQELHGYGIKNIRKTAKKYTGNAYFEYDEKNKLFISTVMFRINN